MSDERPSDSGPGRDLGDRARHLHHVAELFGSPDFRIDPYPILAELRETAPIAQLHPGFWAVSSYEGVRAVLEADGFSSDLRSAAGSYMRPDDLVAHLQDDGVLFVDEPEHTRFRHILNHGFRPRDVSAHRQRMVDVVDDLLTEATQSRTMDFVADFAFPLPIAIIGELVGIPREDRPRLDGWTARFSEQFDVTLAADPARRAVANAAMEECAEYLEALVRARRADPQDDFVTHIATTETHGFQMSDEQAVANLIGVMMAGHETVTATLGHAMLAFSEHPKQWERLAADPSLLPSAALECIRYACPFMFLWRFPTEPIEMLGHRFEVGDAVALVLPAANRDPDKYPDPDRFDVGRNPVDHLAQGTGDHLCLGVSLAPAEIELALAALTSRLRAVQLTVDARDLPRNDSLAMRSFTSMPITFELR